MQITMTSRSLPILVCCATVFFGGGLVLAVDLPTKEDARLIAVYQAHRVWNGVTTTRDGRVFVCYPGADGPGVQAEEIKPDGTHVPYPDAQWNAWKPGQDIAHGFVCVNALRIGPDGSLWMVDAGSPGSNQPAVPGAGRVFQIDLKTDRIVRTYPMADAAKPKSYIDDIRFNGGTAYLTDVGEPGLIVLDLRSGQTRRILDGDPSTTARRPMYANGVVQKDKDGTDRVAHADQLEVSPDGKYLYFQPCPGPMARIETRWLDDATLAPGEVARHVENWWDAPTCGGTAIDAAGNLYFSDTNAQRILKVTPDKEVTTLVADPRLQWSDAMWIDQEGFLWMPATQQNRTPGFTGGKQEVEYPVWIYKMQIGARPAPNDHP